MSTIKEGAGVAPNITGHIKFVNVKGILYDISASRVKFDTEDNSYMGTLTSAPNGGLSADPLTADDKIPLKIIGMPLCNTTGGEVEESNPLKMLQFCICTQEEYDGLEAPVDNILYIIRDVQ